MYLGAVFLAPEILWYGNVCRSVACQDGLHGHCASLSFILDKGKDVKCCMEMPGPWTKSRWMEMITMERKNMEDLMNTSIDSISSHRQEVLQLTIRTLGSLWCCLSGASSGVLRVQRSQPGSFPCSNPQHGKSCTRLLSHPWLTLVGETPLGPGKTHGPPDFLGGFWVPLDRKRYWDALIKQDLFLPVRLPPVLWSGNPSTEILKSWQISSSLSGRRFSRAFGRAWRIPAGLSRSQQSFSLMLVGNWIFDRSWIWRGMSWRCRAV